MDNKRIELEFPKLNKIFADEYKNNWLFFKIICLLY
jgi:hypothetical protein